MSGAGRPPTNHIDSSTNPTSRPSGLPARVQNGSFRCGGGVGINTAAEYLYNNIITIVVRGAT